MPPPFSLRVVVVRAALGVACALLSLCGALVWLDLDGVGARHGGVPPRLRPHRPLPIRLANFLLGPWRETLIPLQVQRMVEQACAGYTGTSSFWTNFCAFSSPAAAGGYRFFWHALFLLRKVVE